MSKRALAHIEKIEWVKPIEGADNLVYRALDGGKSFKNVSNSYLLKKK